MDENEFEHEGKFYVAVVQNNFPFCEGCAFESSPCGHTPECTIKRKDETNVIFVEKQQ